MTCIGRRRLEAHALGQLDDAAAGDVRAHLDACPSCADEAAALTAERLLFTRRAALPAPAPPPFAAVMERARDGGEPAARGARRGRIWSALAAAAALVGLYAGGRATLLGEEATTPAIVAEPAPRGETCEDPSVTANAVACAESEYGACLLATPSARPITSAPADDVRHEEREEEECSVTCEGVEPHGDEALESRVRGEKSP